MFEHICRQRYGSRYSIRQNQRVCARSWPRVMNCLVALKKTAAEEGYPKAEGCFGATATRSHIGSKVTLR